MRKPKIGDIVWYKSRDNDEPYPAIVLRKADHSNDVDLYVLTKNGNMTIGGIYSEEMSDEYWSWPEEEKRECNHKFNGMKINGHGVCGICGAFEYVEFKVNKAEELIDEISDRCCRAAEYHVKHNSFNPKEFLIGLGALIQEYKGIK